jgi:hypothetical protein
VPARLSSQLKVIEVVLLHAQGVPVRPDVRQVQVWHRSRAVLTLFCWSCAIGDGGMNKNSRTRVDECLRCDKVVAFLVFWLLFIEKGNTVMIRLLRIMGAHTAHVVATP